MVNIKIDYMQKVLFLQPKNINEPDISLSDLEYELQNGSRIVSVTPQYCSVAKGDGYQEIKTFGGFLVVLDLTYNKNGYGTTTNTK